jgi:hypothetical protein
MKTSSWLVKKCLEHILFNYLKSKLSGAQANIIAAQNARQNALVAISIIPYTQHSTMLIQHHSHTTFHDHHHHGDRHHTHDPRAFNFAF